MSNEVKGVNHLEEYRQWLKSNLLRYNDRLFEGDVFTDAGSDITEILEGKRTALQEALHALEVALNRIRMDAH